MNQKVLTRASAGFAAADSHSTGAQPASQRAQARADRIARARAAALTLALVVLQFVMVAAYAWSVTSAAPRNLPVAVTGPHAVVVAMTSRIEAAQPGAFRFIPAASTAQAEADITGRVAYGAIVAGAGAPDVLIAPAASPAAASVLTGLAAHLDGTPASPANVRDIAPSSAADPTGAGFGFTILPLMISSIIGGAALSLVIRRPAQRIAALLAFGVGGGLVTTAVAHTWLGILPGTFLALATATGLAVLAVAGGIAGLSALTARAGKAPAGIALGAALIMLIGNPFSGITSAPEMLPGIWGTIGQLLPTGAVASLLRGAAYFDGARTTGAWIVLAAWAGLGLLLVAIARGTRHHAA
jgi:hypothetical protein